MDQQFVYVMHKINHIWIIMWHIFTSTNNTTAILFPTQLWELLYTYHVIKQCTEKETTSLSNLLLTIKLNYLHDLKIMFQCLRLMTWYVYNSSHNCVGNNIVVVLLVLVTICHIMTQRCFMLCATYTNFWSIICPLEVRCLTPLSKIFQLLLLWRKLGVPREIHRPVCRKSLTSS
jgi:hypothetical protein